MDVVWYSMAWLLYCPADRKSYRGRLLQFSCCSMTVRFLLLGFDKPKFRREAFGICWQSSVLWMYKLRIMDKVPGKKTRRDELRGFPVDALWISQ